MTNDLINNDWNDSVLCSEDTGVKMFHNGWNVVLFTPWSVWVMHHRLRLHTLCQTDKHPSEKSQVSTCVGKRSRASATLWRAGRPFPFPESPFIMTPPPPPPSLTPPSPPSESDEGECWPEVSFSISLTQGGLRSTWKSAEILQLLETSKRARLIKNGSTWSSAEMVYGFLILTYIHKPGFIYVMYIHTKKPFDFWLRVLICEFKL